MHTDVLPDEYEKWVAEKIEQEIGYENIARTVRDYVSMCKQTKIRIRLDIHSVRQLDKLHGKLSKIACEL